MHPPNIHRHTSRYIRGSGDEACAERNDGTKRIATNGTERSEKQQIGTTENGKGRNERSGAERSEMSFTWEMEGHISRLLPATSAHSRRTFFSVAFLA